MSKHQKWYTLIYSRQSSMITKKGKKKPAMLVLSNHLYSTKKNHTKPKNNKRMRQKTTHNLKQKTLSTMTSSFITLLNDVQDFNSLFIDNNVDNDKDKGERKSCSRPSLRPWDFLLFLSLFLESYVRLEFYVSKCPFLPCELRFVIASVSCDCDNASDSIHAPIYNEICNNIFINLLDFGNHLE